MHRIIRRGVTAAVVVLLAVPMSGCLFQMSHRFPPGTEFGRRPVGFKDVRKIDDNSMKNYILAGLLPYTSFGTKDEARLLPDERLMDTEVQTSFNAFDTLIWVVPGFFYGYYLWAPRHVELKGEVVRPNTAPVAHSWFH